MGAGPPARRPPCLEVLHRAADRGRGPGSRRPGHPVLRGRRPLAVRGPDPRRDGLSRRGVDVGRVPELEERRARLRDAGRADRRAEAALQPPPAHPGGRRRGPGAAARLEGAAHRRGRARLAGVAVPGRRGRRHDRDRRLRHRRRQQPPAPDRPHDRPGRRAQGRVGAASRSTRSTRRSRSSPTRRCSSPRTSSGSSPATT